MAERWIPWLYQYGVGGLIFFATLWLVIRTGALQPRNRTDRWLLTLLLAGFFVFLAVHGLWIAAIH
ncbi:MAG: hypothetical protein ACREQA_02800 [Candidatus Binatia bacterium]